jgi:hypothetical protein
VKAKFKGRITLSDLDPPNGYEISGQGDGEVAGFAKGGATVRLEPKDGGTLLSYTVEPTSAANWHSSASGSSTARRRKWPMNFSRNLPLPSIRKAHKANQPACTPCIPP